VSERSKSEFQASRIVLFEFAELTDRCSDRPKVRHDPFTELITSRGVQDRVGSEQVAKTRHIGLQGRARIRGWLIVPDSVDEFADGHRTPLPQDECCKEGALSAAGEFVRDAEGDLDRAEHSNRQSRLHLHQFSRSDATPQSCGVGDPTATASAPG
jgi:hypothetical protein